MKRNLDLRILFATSFSDACFRTAPALAQLGDQCRIDLTILHVTKPGVPSIETRRTLNSFLAEADSYDSCRRLLIESEDPVESIAQVCSKDEFDLVIAPASDRLGLHSLLSSSFRARLMKGCRTPLWTAGHCLEARRPRRSLNTISCLIDFDSRTHPHVRLAMSLASHVGAKLRLVHVIPVCDEGALARYSTSRAPLSPEVARVMVRGVFGDEACPEFDVVVGDPTSETPRLLSACEADLFFVGPGQALGGFLRPSLTSLIDRLPCPVICVDGAAASRRPTWAFERALEEQELYLRTYTGERPLAS